MTSSRVEIPRLHTRSSLIWAFVPLTAAFLFGVQHVVTDPPNRWWAVGALVLIAVLVIAFAGSKEWIDTRPAAFGWQRFFVVRTSMAAGDVTDVRIVTNRGGGLLLGVTGRTGRRRYLPLLALTGYVEASQPAPVLRAIADAVAATGQDRGAVAAALRQQAVHVEAGGPASGSPLAPRISNRLGSMFSG